MNQIDKFIIESDTALNRAVSWIDMQLGNFSIQRYKNSTRLVNLIKPLGELGLLGTIIIRHGDENQQDRARSWMNFVWSELENGDVLHSLLLIRPDLLVFMTLFSSFYTHGFKNEKLHCELRKIIKNRGFYYIEMAPWRRLDLLVALYELKLIDRAEIIQCFNQTWLHHMPEPWTITPSSAYGVTHTIFYMTGYGSYNWFGDQISAYLRKSLPVWLNYYIEDGNFDLSSELIMAAACLDDTKLDGNTIRKLIGSQGKLGDVKNRNPQPTGLHFGESDARRLVFLDCYHTTIVFAAALAMCRTAVKRGCLSLSFQ